jgi:hypothetical protein
VLQSMGYRNSIHLSFVLFATVIAAGCNKQKLPNTTVATQDTGQQAYSQDAANRDDANKAADRETNVALEKLRLAQASEQAQLSKDQFAAQDSSSNHRSDNELEGTKYSADKNTEAQKSQALQGTFGSIGSALAGGYMNVQAAKANAKGYEATEKARAAGERAVEEARGAREDKKETRAEEKQETKDQFETNKSVVLKRLNTTIGQNKQNQLTIDQQSEALQYAFMNEEQRKSVQRKPNTSALVWAESEKAKNRSMADIQNDLDTAKNQMIQRENALNDLKDEVTTSRSQPQLSRINNDIKDYSRNETTNGAAASPYVPAVTYNDPQKILDGGSKGTLTADAENAKARLLAESQLMQDALAKVAAHKNTELKPEDMRDSVAKIQKSGVAVDPATLNAMVDKANEIRTGKDPVNTAKATSQVLQTQTTTQVKAIDDDIKNVSSSSGENFQVNSTLLQRDIAPNHLGSGTVLQSIPQTIRLGKDAVIPKPATTAQAGDPKSTNSLVTGHSGGKASRFPGSSNSGGATLAANDNSVDSVSKQSNDYFSQIKDIQQKIAAAQDDPEAAQYWRNQADKLSAEMGTYFKRAQSFDTVDADKIRSAESNLKGALQSAVSDSSDDFMDKYGKHSNYTAMSQAWAGNAPADTTSANELFGRMDALNSSGGAYKVASIAPTNGTQKNNSNSAPVRQSSGSTTVNSDAKPFINYDSPEYSSQSGNN